MMKKAIVSLLLFSFFAMMAISQADDGVLRMDEFRNPQKRQIIQIPDIGDYTTLKCDFHMHTVFSDGLVWPTVRVQEAVSEGLDLIAITDHIEYTPHAKDVPVNFNRSWELAKAHAAANNLLFIKGVELTRRTPPGHFNALFIGDASDFIADNQDNSKDKEAVLKAAQQNAFIYWNHPGWKANQIEGSYEWIVFVEELYNENILQGIEVINGFGLHKKALDWCIDKNLTVMGSSDIHNLIDYDYAIGDLVHRSMTLVLAKERTTASVREALEEGRTVAWSSKYLAGKEEHVRALFSACVVMGKSHFSTNRWVSKGVEIPTDYYEIRNISDLYFELHLAAGDGPGKVILYPQTSCILKVPTGQEYLTYEVVSTFIRSDKHLMVELPLN